MLSRREAREQAFILIFEKSFRDESIEDIIELAKESRELVPDEFGCSLAVNTFLNITTVDEAIEKLSTNWKKNRISKVAFSILRLAMYEILFEDDIPSSVTINEAVEVAKKYGGEEDSSFINGILGSATRGGLDPKPCEAVALADEAAPEEEQQ